MKHYVYKITDPETGQYYFGSRSNENPETDNYMGSYSNWKPENEDRLIKEIIEDDFETREEAIEFESGIIEEHINDDLNENYHIPNKGFHRHGMKLSDETKMKLSKIQKERFSDPENNPMYGKEHSINTIEKMKKRAKNRWTLEWFIERYGEVEGKRLYEKRCREYSKRMSGKNNPRYGLKGKDNPLYGIKRSEEVKKKISETKSNNILQFSMDGEFIKKWNSVREAAEHYDIHINSIYHNLKERRPHANGYLWKYE